MASIVVKSAWPTNSSKMIGETWMGMKPPPNFMNLVWVGVEGVEGQGLSGLILWQCKDDKIAEAYDFIREDISRYFNVPGYTYSYRIWTEPQDALKMVGLA